MGLIERILGAVFGGGRNTIVETVEVFRENAEKSASRANSMHGATLEQFAGEFRLQRRGWFDRLMDAINRVPRPALALGTLGLFIAAMVDPVWFAARMQGIALVPEPLWWLLGAIVSFYFGARHQSKGQQFQRELAETIARVPGVVHNLKSLEALEEGEADMEAGPKEDNPALNEWRRAS
ncbi:holin family protein [Primorskyibacter sp. S187A]|uniref:holin family protein n=1 Tax=Primorskyibacter sp. S187A TaxID=3415130 RepID=UPI003C7C2CB7